MQTPAPTPETPRWLNAWAGLTLLATLPLLFLGAEVTTKDVGMVDPRGFRPPWELIRTMLQDSGLGIQIEYGHRLAGMVVGLCVIALNVFLWIGEKRRWVRWVGALALALVILQGVLGIFRVELNAIFHRNLALVHGLFAQTVIATLASLAFITSRAWRTYAAPARDGSDDAGLARMSLWMIVLMVGQLVLGGIVRHRDLVIGPRGHVLGAFAVVVGVVIWTWRLSAQDGRWTGWTRVLLTLITIQVALGVETWLAKFFVPTADLPQLSPSPLHTDWIRSGHYLVGAGLFSTTVLTALSVWAPKIVRRLESSPPAQLAWAGANAAKTPAEGLA